MSTCLKYTFCFKILNLRYTIRSNSLLVIIFLKRLLSLFPRDRLSCIGPKKKIIINIRKRRNEDMHNTLIHAYARLYTSLVKYLNKELLFLHAASLEMNKNYWIIAGASESGKSSITALLRDLGAHVLNDDATQIEYKTGRIISFPFFPTIKIKSEFSNLQKRHLKGIMPFMKKHGYINRLLLAYTSEEEFKSYYAYSKELYSYYKSRAQKQNKNRRIIIIYLKKCPQSKTTKLHNINLTESMNMLTKSMCIDKNCFKRNLQPIIALLGNANSYILESPSAKKAVQLLSSKLAMKKIS